MRYNIIFLCIICLYITGCQQKQSSLADEHPRAFVGKWRTVKKIYSNDIEELYREDDEIYHLKEDGQLRRDYRDSRRDTIRNQSGEWKVLIKKGRETGADTSYFIKRTPMFNGIFEEQFRVVSKTDREMVLEEGKWGFEKDEIPNRYHLVKIE